MLRGQCFCQQQIEDPERDSLGQWADVANRANAPRTPVLALALEDELSRCSEQLVVQPIEGLAEPNAAWVVVVHEDARALRLGVDGNANVVAVAHQQQLRYLLHR